MKCVNQAAFMTFAATLLTTLQNFGVPGFNLVPIPFAAVGFGIDAQSIMVTFYLFLHLFVFLAAWEAVMATYHHLTSSF